MYFIKTTLYVITFLTFDILKNIYTQRLLVLLYGLKVSHVMYLKIPFIVLSNS